VLLDVALHRCAFFAAGRLARGFVPALVRKGFRRLASSEATDEGLRLADAPRARRTGEPVMPVVGAPPVGRGAPPVGMIPVVPGMAGSDGVGPLWPPLSDCGGPPAAGPLAPSGAPVRAELRSGICCLWQVASGRYGGRLPGYAGRVPRGGLARLNACDGGAVVRRAGAERLRAAAGLEAHVLAVGVEVLALAGEAHQRVPELLVVLDAGGEGPVLDLDVARGQDVRSRHLANRFCCGKKRTAASVARARSRAAGLRSRARPPSSSGPTRRRACSMNGNEASMVAGVSRTPGRISRANARVFGKRC
jgi:hypothetical protein